MQNFKGLHAESQSTIIKRRLNLPAVDNDNRKRSVSSLLKLLNLDHETERVELLLRLFDQPNKFKDKIYLWLSDTERYSIFLIGSIDERVAVVRDLYSGTYAITFGSHGFESFPSVLRFELESMRSLSDHVYFSSNSDHLTAYISTPSIYLTTLYHPENFPLPRFSLAISDLMRVCRREGVANLKASDMQLGTSIDDILYDIQEMRPDIVGISATFGQHDILEKLLAETERYNWSDTQIVFGGSLSALNKNLLLERFPHAFVATGPGENSMRGLIRHYRNELDRGSIPGLAMQGNEGTFIETPRTSPRDTADMLPELDLLAPTLERKGAIQLESSRGCSYACSFCPRTHKGVWAGDDPRSFSLVLKDIKRIKDYYPHLADRIFLVDEEFFGYRAGGESEQRVAAVSGLLNSYGFSFETSSRLDQIFRPQKDLSWHQERLELWRLLISHQMERCLFGIESGVDTVLTRFNKKTTSWQNTVGIRLISLLGVPPRYTYITFDPLMNRDELIATYQFLGRTDILLKTVADSHSNEEIFSIATNDELAQVYGENIPFYEMVSYLLVSMECLIGAPYTKFVEDHGLLGPINSKMGRFEVRYADPDIEIFSRASQAWIDRNFSLDYLFKGMNKYSNKENRKIIQNMRSVVKKYAYELLGLMIGLWDSTAQVLPNNQRILDKVSTLSPLFLKSDPYGKMQLLHELMDAHFSELVREMGALLKEVNKHLSEEDMSTIRSEFVSWSSRTEWTLINGPVENC